MKYALTLVTIAALSAPVFAQKPDKKKAPEKPAAEASALKPAEAAPAQPEKKAREAKTADDAAPRAMPMNARADMIDAGAKTFTQKRKDGVEVKHMVTDKTVIMQGEAPAKFEDIKAGDQVSGSRMKKSDTEYEVTKITKFAPSGKKMEEKPAGEKKKKE